MAGMLTGRRILVVEDDFFILSEMEHTLMRAGAKVVSARTVEQALSQLHDSEFTGAILDFRLGRGNGTPVASALAKRGIPFVFYTGQATSELAGTEWSQVKVISKPSTPTAILAVVSQWL
jgi:DNA-binding NtrC family response regulator